MSTDTVTDLETLCQAIAAGAPIDPALRTRLKAGAEKVRQSILEREGKLNVAVDLIREIRE